MRTMDVLFVLLVLGGVWTVITPTLLQAAIALALTSSVLAVVMFELGARLAAVFELSVCAGLITVVFVSAISLTRRGSAAAERALAKTRMKRFIWLPVLVVAVAAIWQWAAPALLIVAPPPTGEALGVQTALWVGRRYDILGQVLLILTGVFGVVILFKGSYGDEEGSDNE